MLCTVQGLPYFQNSDKITRWKQVNVYLLLFRFLSFRMLKILIKALRYLLQAKVLFFWFVYHINA